MRPIPQMSGFPSVTWDGWEKYHALALTFTQRLWRGLTVNSNYTWSKALDDASNPGPDNAEPNFPQDPSQLAAEKGLSDFDHRHRFVTNFLYQIPFLKNSEGWVHTAFGEWQVGGIWTLQSGAPFTVNLLDGRRQQRRTLVRAIPTAESGLQSKQRSKNNVGMVQYILLYSARCVYLWQRGP